MKISPVVYCISKLGKLFAGSCFLVLLSGTISQLSAAPQKAGVQEIASSGIDSAENKGFSEVSAVPYKVEATDAATYEAPFNNSVAVEKVVAVEQLKDSAADEPGGEVQDTQLSVEEESTEVVPASDLSDAQLVSNLGINNFGVRQEATRELEQRLAGDSSQDAYAALIAAEQSGRLGLEHLRRVEQIIALTVIDWPKVFRAMRNEAERQFQHHTHVADMEIIRRALDTQWPNLEGNRVNNLRALFERLFPAERRWSVNEVELEFERGPGRLRASLSHWDQHYALVSFLEARSIILYRTQGPEFGDTIPAALPPAIQIRVVDFISPIQLRRTPIQNPNAAWDIRFRYVTSDPDEAAYYGYLVDRENTELRDAALSFAPAESCAVEVAWPLYLRGLENDFMRVSDLRAGRPFAVQ